MDHKVYANKISDDVHIDRPKIKKRDTDFHHTLILCILQHNPDTLR